MATAVAPRVADATPSELDLFRACANPAKINLQGVQARQEASVFQNQAALFSVSRGPPRSAVSTHSDAPLDSRPLASHAEAGEEEGDGGRK